MNNEIVKLLQKENEEMKQEIAKLTYFIEQKNKDQIKMLQKELTRRIKK